jgi:DNA-binding transcriptional regulator YhcF (GntR family)
VTALRRRETLTSQLTKTLTERIAKGALKPGDKLPSEQELIEQFGVSRTVVREAISSLRAAGLVATQQGVGAFVQAAAASQPFRIDENSLDLIKEVINVVELRIGLEAEAAALAAQAPPVAAFCTGLLLSMVAQAGDLLESAIKRKLGVKDSGRTIPGHGGLFDRLDGFLTAAPVAALLTLAMQGGLG